MSEMQGGGEGGHRFGSLVAVLIALTTFVAAVAGYLQADTSARADGLRLNAERLSLEAAASVQRQQEQAQVGFEMYARSVEQRTEAANTMLRYLYAGEDEAEQRRLELERARWEALADASVRHSGIDEAGEFGPQQDPVFPARYFASATYEGHRLNALQDAGNEVANILDERSAAFTAILAMLAISLYLFGLTLAVEERLFRLSFLAVGLVLGLIAAGWMALTALLPQPDIDEAAAAAYARGRVALDTAYDNAGYLAAQSHYDEAIALRPTFGRAYVERASAIALGATPQRSGFVSIIPTEALERERADQLRAIELGQESGPLYSSLGFGAFIEGTRLGDVALLDESVSYLRRAIELDPTEPIHYHNLGVTLVAAGRYDEARHAYADAVGWTLYSDAARTRPRQAPALEEQVLAGALTDLEIVLRHQPAAAEQIRAIKEALVAPISAASLNPPPASPLVIGEVQLDVHPAQIGWQAPVEGYDAERDVISTQWYYQDPASGDWAVLPTVSGTIPLGVAEDGRHFVNAYYVTSVVPPGCLAAGRYRLEIYLNGRLTHPPGSLETETSFADLEAHVGRDVAVAFCRPADWEPLGEDELPGLLTGFRSADGQYGAQVVRVGLPRSWHELPTLTTTFMDLALESFADLLPGPASYYEPAGTETYHFLGLQRSAWRWYDTDVGWVRAGGGLAEDGSVIVGLVYGPYDWFDGNAYFEVLGSMVRLD